MVELILGCLSFAAITVGIRVYLAFFIPRGLRHERFERWCEERPLLLAMFVPRAGTSDVAGRVAASSLGPPCFVNLAGGFPWTHYGIALEAEVLSECVVGVSLARARVLRGREAPPTVAELVRVAAREARGQATEIWLHVDLFVSREDSPAKDDAIGWWGKLDARGDLVLTPCAELPFWLRPVSPRGPRDGRQKTDDARETDLAAGSAGVLAGA